MTPAGDGPRKLVLAVIDALAPEGLAQAIEEDKAPTLARLMRDGHYSPDCVSTFPSVTPVAASAIATGLGPDRHLVPSMNWYHRGEERYVEYGTSFSASRAHGMFRSLQDTVYNMNLAHLSQEERTVFEQPGRRRPAHRLHHLPDLPRPPPPRAVARLARTCAWPRRRSSGTRSGARASCSTPTCSTPATPAARRRWACPASATATPRAWARSWWPTTRSTSCCSACPTTTRTRTGRARRRSPTSIAGADAALARLMDAAGGPDEFLAEHAVIVMSDHSHDLVEAATNLSDVLSGWRVLEPVDLDPEARRAGGVPGLALGPDLRAGRRPAARPRPRAWRRTWTAWPAWTWWRGSRAGARWWARRAASCASRPAGPRPTTAARAGTLDGDLEALDLSLEGGALAYGVYPDALRRLWSARHLRAHRRPAAVGRAGLRVHRLGRRRPRGRRQPRLAARVRLARRAADLRRRLGAAPGRRAVVDRGRHARWCWTTSGWPP